MTRRDRLPLIYRYSWIVKSRSDGDRVTPAVNLEAGWQREPRRWSCRGRCSRAFWPSSKRRGRERWMGRDEVFLFYFLGCAHGQGQTWTRGVRDHLGVPFFRFCHQHLPHESLLPAYHRTKSGQYRYGPRH